VRARDQATVNRVDYGPAMSVVMDLVRCWKHLRFDRDAAVVVPRSHQRREGLRVLEGVHPNPGTRYRVVIVERVAPEFTDEERRELTKLGAGAAGRDQMTEWARRRRAALEASGRMESKTTSLDAELLANDAETLTVRFVAASQRHVNIDVTVERPAAPRTVAIVVDGRLEGSWWARGAVAGTSRLSIDRLPPEGSSSPQLEADLRHRRAMGSATVRVRPGDGDTWGVSVDIRARGRGVVRPLAAITSPWLARAVRRQLRASMAGLPDRVRTFNDEWRLRDTPAAQRAIAQQWLDDFLDTLPASVPRTPKA
jgi:hypothetical protein